MKSRCKICRGSQTIRLPVYQEMVASFDPGMTCTTVDDASKVYACPECAPLVAADQVRVVECHFQADTRYEHEQEYRKYVVRQGVMEIAHKIEELGFMRLQSAPANIHEFKRGYRVTVGVVSPRIVADMDAAQQAAEEKFAEAVVAVAISEINNWGSYYGHRTIHKEDVERVLREAITRAKARRTSRPVMTNS